MNTVKRTIVDKFSSVSMALMGLGLSLMIYSNHDSILGLLGSSVLFVLVILHLVIALYKFRTPFISLDGNAITFHMPRHKYIATVDDITDVFYHKKAGMHYGYFEVHFRNRKPLKVSNGAKIKHHECVYDVFVALQIPVHNFEKQNNANQRIHSIAGSARSE